MHAIIYATMTTYAISDSMSSKTSSYQVRQLVIDNYYQVISS